MVLREAHRDTHPAGDIDPIIREGIVVFERANDPTIQRENTTIALNEIRVTGDSEKYSQSLTTYHQFVGRESHTLKPLERMQFSAAEAVLDRELGDGMGRVLVSWRRAEPIREARRAQSPQR